MSINCSSGLFCAPYSPSSSRFVVIRLHSATSLSLPDSVSTSPRWTILRSVSGNELFFQDPEVLADPGSSLAGDTPSKSHSPRPGHLSTHPAVLRQHPTTASSLRSIRRTPVPCPSKPRPITPPLHLSYPAAGPPPPPPSIPSYHLTIQCTRTSLLLSSHPLPPPNRTRQGYPIRQAPPHLVPSAFASRASKVTLLDQRTRSSCTDASKSGS